MIVTFEAELGLARTAKIFAEAGRIPDLDVFLASSLPVLFEDHIKVGTARNLRIKQDALWATVTIQEQYAKCSMGITYTKNIAYVWVGRWADLVNLSQFGVSG